MRTFDIEERRTWNFTDMRNFCIRHEFFTCGDNAHYEAFLDFVRNSHPSTRNITAAAEVLYEQSELYDNVTVIDLMNMILNEVVKFHYVSVVAEGK